MWPLFSHFATSDATGCSTDSITMKEETLLKLCVSNLHTIGAFQDENGDFLPISRWPGVSISIEGSVDQIEWLSYKQVEVDGYVTRVATGLSPGGSIDFQHLPRELTHFSAPRMYFEGAMETADLPRQLEVFDVHANALIGQFATESLPRILVAIDVADNKLHGSLHIDTLPYGLKSLSAGGNAFTGGLRFVNLPECIELLDVQRNAFSGSIDLRHLPNSLNNLNLQSNLLAQSRLLVGKPRASFTLLLDEDKMGNVYYAVR